MVGNTVALTGTGLNKTEATTLYVPLQFWLNLDLKNIPATKYANNVVENPVSISPIHTSNLIACCA